MPVTGTDHIFFAGKLAGLQLKNRVIRAGCFEGMCQAGQVTDSLIEHHRPLGASAKFCLFTRSYCRQMSRHDSDEKIRDFVNAARMAKEAGFDAVEIHAGHGYLLSQFLSPWTNKRKDEFGGSLKNRLLFPIQVIEKTRNNLGAKFPVLIKMNQFDGMNNGLNIHESEIVAKAFEKAGASVLVPSSGFTSKVPFLMLRGRLPIAEMSDNQQGRLSAVSLYSAFVSV